MSGTALDSCVCPFVNLERGPMRSMLMTLLLLDAGNGGRCGAAACGGRGALPAVGCPQGNATHRRTRCPAAQDAGPHGLGAPAARCPRGQQPLLPRRLHGRIRPRCMWAAGCGLGARQRPYRTAMAVRSDCNTKTGEDSMRTERCCGSEQLQVHLGTEVCTYMIVLRV